MNLVYYVVNLAFPRDIKIVLKLKQLTVDINKKII